MFIDASQQFDKVRTKNVLRPEHIQKIVDTYKARTNEEKYSHVATLESIKSNDYNLNIPRYVDTFEAEDSIDLSRISAQLTELDKTSQTTDATKSAEYFERVRHEIERMQSLINDLLLIAELEDQTPVAPEIINFSREVAHLSSDLKTLQSMRPIETIIEPGILVNISHNYAQQMLANIFANLRRHTPEDSQVLIVLATAGNKAVLTIADAGPGLPEEVYKSGIQYFQRFDRSRSRESGGSGLGMTIMKRIIENAGGSIQLGKSQFGGLEIEINLPISRD